MSLLVTPYNPTASVEVLVNAIEAGQRRRTQEQAIIAGLAKAIADDRRHALEWDRVQAFNREKEAEDTRRFEVTRAENTRRYNLENSPVTVPALDNPAPVTTAAVRSEAPTADTSIPGDPSAEILNLDTAGGALPPSRSLLTGEQLDTSPDAMGFQERLAAKRAEQLKQGLAAVEQIGPGAAEASAAQRALELRAQGAAAAAQYPVPTLEGGNIALQQAAPVDPFSPAPARVPATLPPDGNIAGPLPAATGDQMMDPGPSALIPPGKQVSRYVADLADAGMPVRRKDLPALQRTALASALRAQNRTTASGGRVLTMQDAIQQYGLTPNPASGTYKTRDGMEYFVGQGVGGGVSLTPRRPKEEKERIIATGGNVWLIPPQGGEPRKIISKEVSDTLPNAVPMKYATALAAEEAGRANLDEVTRVWETRKAESKPDAQAIADLEKEVQFRQAALRKADAVVQNLRKQYPLLAGSEEVKAGSTSVPAGAQNTYSTAADVKAAVKAGKLTREEGLAILQSQFGLE